MKTKNRFLIVSIGLMTTVLFLVGCMDNNYYPKVSETLNIQNGTDTTIYVEYGFLEPDIYPGRKVTVSFTKSMSGWLRFEDTQITGLWMSEKEFNKYVSKIRIYNLIKGDSIFVDPHYFNTKSAWKSNFYNSGSSIHDYKENRNELTILPEMFNK
jgi:hypothetical protein